MTNQQYNKIKKIIDKLEDEVLKEGDDITSDAFQKAVEHILSQRGFTLKEYQEMEKKEKMPKRNITVSMDEEDFNKTIDERVSGERQTTIESEEKLVEQIEKVANRVVRYDELEGKPKILSDNETQKIAEQETRKIKIPKQLTREDVENIVKPLIPEMPEIPEQRTFNQDDIKGLKLEQIAIDPKETDKKIETLKEEMIKYVNQMSVPRGSVGANTGRGSRFFNWGMPDKGSYGTAIPDSRYALKGEGATFVDDEAPAGTKDGSNTTFTLAYTPISGSVKLFLGGAKLEITNDYSISGKTITMIFAPSSGETLLADYRR